MCYYNKKLGFTKKINFLMFTDKIETFLLSSTFQYYLNPFLILFFTYQVTTFQYPCFQLWLLHVFFPLMDCLLPLDNRNPSKNEIKSLENKLSFKLPLYLSVILDWLSLFYLQSWFFYHKHELSYLQIFFLVLTVGYAGAGNINVAHELLHKNNILDKLMGMTTLIKNMYLHFYIEHTHGHHRRVATKEDPASSRRNETLYQFIPRTIVGSWVSAWHIEEKRLGTKEFSLHNRMHIFLICYFLMPTVIHFLYGSSGIIFFLTSAFMSIVFLETINYIEHYGLERKEISPGVYEKVSIKHSWNAPHRFTNYILFKLQRHSDHHENAYKPYQTLCTYEESPFLPHGYTVCLFLATSPKAWFEVMNEVLDDYKSGIKKNQHEISQRNWKIYKVLLQHGVIFTGLLAAEIMGFTKII